jgi:DnaK suppressor protein
LELLHKSFAPHVPSKGEKYMNPKQLSHFKAILTALKKELSRDIDRTVHTMQDVVPCVVSAARDRNLT